MKDLTPWLGHTLSAIVVGASMWGAPAPQVSRSGLSPAQGKIDVILEWNAVALEANVLNHSGREKPSDQLTKTQGPPASARVLAMVHAAMFDAYNSVDQRYTPYLTFIPTGRTASPDAAVAQAAHDTLVGLIPAGAPFFEVALRKTLERIPEGQAKQQGIDIGTTVAAEILAARANDDVFLRGTYTPSGEPGNHDVDPENPLQSFLNPEFGKVPPFGVQSVLPFRAPEPPPLSSREYSRALKEVKELGEFRGGATGTTVPTDDETYVVAIYWSYNASPGIGTPPRLYNQIARTIAIELGNEVHENARLFALVNISMADGGISSWDSKYAYSYWRPILGIRLADTDGNFRTRPDRDWEPLGGSRSNPFPGESNFTPPFPAYTSGHATFGAAAFKTLANFYQRDDIEFTFVSDEWNGSTLDEFGRVRPLLSRTYSSLSRAAAENAASRVFNGVHWRFDGTEGVRSGNGIADLVFDTLLRPLDGGPLSIPDEDFEGQIEEILDDACGDGDHHGGGGHDGDGHGGGHGS